MAATTIKRNNNPGAIEDGPFARRQKGYVKGGGRFAKFVDEASGIAAQEALLREGKHYRGKGINDIVRTYSPVSRENPEQNVRNYTAYVAQRTGLDPTKPIDPKDIPAVAAAMREFETGNHQIRISSAGGPAGNPTASGVPDVVPGGTLPPRTDVSKLEPGAAEVAQMNQGNKFKIRDPFTSDAEIAAEGETVENRGTALDNTLQSAITALDTIQPQREAALRRAVEVKTGINQELQGETRALLARAKPLFQRREAIATRTRELAEMNPLERAVKGIFNPNYNEVDLRARDQAYAKELEVLGSNYSYATNLQDTLTRLIDADFANQNSVWQLQIEDLSQDVALMTQSFSVSQSILGATMQDLDNQVALHRAQATARADMLSQMTIGQVNAALSQAQSNGTGYATVNGVPIAIQELVARQRNDQEQQDALESRAMAIEGQRVDLASRYEDRLIAHMTPAQIEQAIKDGGQYQGQQLDIGKLTAAYGSLRARQQQQIEDIASNSAPGLMRNMIGGVRNSFNGTTQRMMGIFGTIPEEQRQAMTVATAEIQAINEGFAAAEAQGVGAQYARANLPRLQALYKKQDDIIKRSAAAWAGGNKDLVPVAEAWMRGAPLSSEAAVRGLIQMSRSGIPAGTKLSGPAAQAFRIVQGIVRAEDTPKAGQTIEQMMAAPQSTKDERTRQLIARVQGALAGTYQDRLMDEVVRATPSLSRQVQVGGRAHPFSQVNAEDFQNATSWGDQQGYQRVGQELDLSADEARQMFSQGINGPIWKRVKEAKDFGDDKFAVYGRRLAALQTQLMMQSLDASGSAKPGFRPSQAYVDLVNNGQFQGLIGNVVANSGRASFGDFLASTVAGPGFGDAYRNYALGTRTAYTTSRSAEFSAAVERARDPAGNPIRRAGMVMRAMEGVTPQEAQRLLSAIQPMIQSNTQVQIEDTMREAGVADSSSRGFSMIVNIIQNKKFDDPELEAIRRRVAAQWPKSQAMLDRIFGTSENEGMA